MTNVLDKYSQVFTDACRKDMRRASSAQSAKQLADVALSISAIPYIAGKIAVGLLPRDVMMRELSPFANGRYVRSLDGYTSAFYVGEPSVEISTTAALVIDCPECHVPQDSICEIHVVGDTSVTGYGRARVCRYMSDGTVSTTWHGTV